MDKMHRFEPERLRITGVTPVPQPALVLTLALPVRTWATLDAALTFFREAPFQVPAARRLSRHCRMFHAALLKAGIRWQYMPVATVAPGKSLLRLHVTSCSPRGWRPLVELSRPIGRSLAEACMSMIEVQTEPEIGALLDHEAEELQAALVFLSELRRQAPRLLTSISHRYGRRQLRWDSRRREFHFTDRLALRIQQHYLRARAGLN